MIKHRFVALWGSVSERAGWATPPSVVRSVLLAVFVMGCYFVLVPQTTRVVLELRSNAGSDGEIFWDDGTGYNPGNSQIFGIDPDNQWHRITVEGGAGPWRRLRVDPGSAAGQVEIRAIEVHAGLAQASLRGAQLINALGVRNGVERIGGGEPLLQLALASGDPFLDFELPEHAGSPSILLQLGLALLAGLLAGLVWLGIEGVVHEVRHRAWLRWVAWLLLAALLLVRWKTKGAAFAAAESDYGVHIAIVEWFGTRPYWPPAYGGILGAHSIAALLHEFGLTIPRAMLIVSDLGAVLLFGSIARVVWPMGVLPRIAALAYVLAYSTPLFSVTVRDAFFGPTLSLGLNALGVATLLTASEVPSLRRLAFSTVCLLMAGFAYPDCLSWCLPFLLYVSRGALKVKWWRAAALAVCVIDFVILSKQFALLPSSGGGLFEWNALLSIMGVLGLALILSEHESLTAQRTKVLFFGWACVAALLCFLGFLLTGEYFPYYARKAFYASAFVLPFVAASLATRLGGGLLALAGIALITSNLSTTLREPQMVAYQRFLKPRSHFDERDEACIRRTQVLARKRACKRLLVLPGSKDGQGDAWGQRIFRTIASNAYAGEFSVRTGFRALRNGPFENPFSLTDMLRNDPARALVEVSLDSQDEVDCLALGPELVPPERRGKDCLVIVTPGEIVAAAESKGYQGFQDSADCNHVTGWAFAPGFPRRRLKVELLSGTEVIASKTADAPRADLTTAGVDDGLHAFDFTVPPSLKDGKAHRLTVRIAGTDIILPGPSEVLCKAPQPVIVDKGDLIR